MPRFGISGSQRFTINVLIVVLVSLCGFLGAQNQPSNQTPVSKQDQLPFQLKVASNLVVVRVVVRDAHGNAIDGLRKEDFELFDGGRPQTISQFSVEAPPAANAYRLGDSDGSRQRDSSAHPARPRTLALYFDDLHMDLAEVNSARAAADKYLDKNLQPYDRVGIFTSSTLIHTDFTHDVNVLHQTLSQLVPIPEVQGCQVVDDYTAEQIVDRDDPDAISVGAYLAKTKCHICELSGCAQANADYAVQQAQTVAIESRRRAQRSLEALMQVVNRLAMLPGPRSVIVVSAGFLSKSLLDPGARLQAQVDQIIDQALRLQVVISSLDPAGVPAQLAGEPEDAGTSFVTTDVGLLMRAFSSARKLSATGVLADMARGTGGDLFHNNNDLKAGFARLAQQPVSYILAFVPADVDGKFHTLRVKLTRSKGIVEARRGYYAPRNGVNGEVEEAATGAQEQILDAVLSKADTSQFGVNLSAKLTSAKGGLRQLSLFTHVDATPLRFHRDGDHNLNTITFVCAVFDQQENLVDSERRRAKVDIPDTELPRLVKAGLDANMDFQLKPGIYRIREVVTDSEERHMTTFSKTVEIP